MDLVNRIFERADFQNLREYLLSGDDAEKRSLSYDERLETEIKPIMGRLEILISNSSEFDDAFSDLNRALQAYEEVYMEIGMKIGARLLHDLLFTADNP